LIALHGVWECKRMLDIKTSKGSLESVTIRQ
jgi:hypothetical protein